MREILNFTQPKAYLEMKKLRLEFGMPEPEPNWKQKAGSQDLKVATEAQINLINEVDLKQSEEKKPLRVVDLLEQFEKYSPEERDIILNNLVALQLTEGCNGHCPFCLFGKSDGVTAQYSADSICRFIHKYGHKIRQVNKQVALFWASDPFDYRDGTYSYQQVFKQWQKCTPDVIHFVSTAIPRDSEDNFVEFMMHLYTMEELRGMTSPKQRVRVRLSVSKPNIKRVEAALAKLDVQLKERGANFLQRKRFLDRYIDVAGRGTVNNVGAFIAKADPIRDVYTPACQDGVIMHPDGVEAIAMTAPTVYEPSGQKNIPLEPGSVAEKCIKMDFINFWSGKHDISLRMADNTLFLPDIKDVRGNDYILNQNYEGLPLRLGRAVLAYKHFITDVSGIENYPEFKKLAPQQKAQLLDQLMFHLRQAHDKHRIYQDAIKASIKFGEITPETREKLNYYATLYNVYYQETLFLLQQYERKTPLEKIAKIANKMLYIGRGDVDNLPAVFDKMVSEV